MKSKVLFSGALLILLVGMSPLWADPIDAYRNAYLIETGERDLERAVVLYEEVIASSGADKTLISRSYLRMGLCYEQMEKLDAAKVAFQQAIQFSPASETDTHRLALEGVQRVDVLREQQEKERLLELYRTSSSTATSQVEHAQLQIYTALEVFAAGGESMQPSLKSAQDYLTSANFSQSASLKVSPGYGVRIGLLTPERGAARLQFGVATDFVTVPDITGTVRYNYGTGTASAQIQETINYYRVLGELRKPVRLSDRVSVVLHGGVGFSYVQLRARSSSGSFLIPDLPSGTSDSFGFTYEIGPSLSIMLGTTRMEVGLTYTQFPGIAEADNQSDIEWHPVGGNIALFF